MLKLKIISGEAKAARYATSNLPGLLVQDRLRIEGLGLAHSWRGSDGSSYFLLGHVIGIRQSDGTLSNPVQLKMDAGCLEDPQRVAELEGRFVVVRAGENGICEVWTDQFGRVDVYWQLDEGNLIVATGMDMLPVATIGAASDTVGVAHALTVYGSRPAKEHTLYAGVRRLGVNQIIRITEGSCEVIQRAFVPATTAPTYQNSDLHRYADRLIEAIRARASNDGNVVYLSSGWDSTSILAVLVHLFGNRKVRAVIGRMKYSDRSGVINQIEIDRARGVADYFRVRLDIVELDYRDSAGEVINDLQGLFRAQQFANIAGCNHWKLAEGTARKANGAEAIFAGEMSDGAHNLGFSQFTTIFHPASFEFREYSDKMASYLFGPTFLEQLQKGAHGQDPIWQLFVQRSSSTKFDPRANGNTAITQQMLASFFLRGGRIPLYSLDNTPLLSPAGRAIYSSESERVYLADAAKNITSETLYAHYLQLYNSFHWQGATVSTLEHTAAAHGLRCVLPFHDSAVIDFLSAMPETWGRGLDLNPTKYPLKWMLRNRIDYPHHLQVGPHSYTYDVDPNFTLIGEILHASSFKPHFQKALKERRFVSWIDSEQFDLTYIDGIVYRYLLGEELRGQELNDIAALSMHSAIGIY